MSFFGLTAFGPENFIRSSKVDSNGFTLFSNDEFKIGFYKVCKIKNATVINISDVKNFLHFTFGFTPLNEEIKVFTQQSGKTNDNEELTWDEVLVILEQIKDDLMNKSVKSTKYTSFQKYHEDTFKHKRKEVYPNETFKMPVTFSQSYGFYKVERNLNETRFPRKKCEETKYAESIIMTGTK